MTKVIGRSEHRAWVTKKMKEKGKSTIQTIERVESNWPRALLTRITTTKSSSAKLQPNRTMPFTIIIIIIIIPVVFKSELAYSGLGTGENV